MALGASKWKTIATVVLPAAYARYPYRYVAGASPGGGGNGTVPVYGVWKPLLGPGLGATDRFVPVMIYSYAIPV